MDGKKVTTGTGLLVGDIDTMVKFYRDTLGLHTDWEGGDFAKFETGSGDLSLFM
ncbi:VOC family protein, partial [Enterococcus sp. LJL90]